MQVRITIPRCPIRYAARIGVRLNRTRSGRGRPTPVRQARQAFIEGLDEDPRPGPGTDCGDPAALPGNGPRHRSW